MKRILVTALALAAIVSKSQGNEAGNTFEPIKPNDTAIAAWASAVEPKPLSANVKKGLDWLVKAQHDDGGWSQGEEAQTMGNGMDQVKSVSNVADTCMATLALIRAGSTPKDGEHAKQIKKALDFVCAQIEDSDAKDLYVTKIRGIRAQAKLGAYIDTFLASMLLADARLKMPDDASTKRVAVAYNKVMDKIEKNQKADGTWDSGGWAPTLQQAVAAKAVNHASQSDAAQLDVKNNGTIVAGGGLGAGLADKAELDRREACRRKVETWAQSNYGPKAGAPGEMKREGSAGVELYAWSATVGSLQESANTNASRTEKARKDLEKPAADLNPEARLEAQKEIQQNKQNSDDLAKVQAAMVQKMTDQRFLQGFGNNGGEEFLSYMNLGESLVVKAGADWLKWDKSTTENLNHIQNDDGSWTGHHCITGRTFCTSAALLALTVDRTSVPIAAKIHK